MANRKDRRKKAAEDKKKREEARQEAEKAMGVKEPETPTYATKAEFLAVAGSVKELGTRIEALWRRMDVIDDSMGGLTGRQDDIEKDFDLIQVPKFEEIEKKQLEGFLAISKQTVEDIEEKLIKLGKK